MLLHDYLLVCEISMARTLALNQVMLFGAIQNNDIFHYRIVQHGRCLSRNSIVKLNFMFIQILTTSRSSCLFITYR